MKLARVTVPDLEMESVINRLLLQDEVDMLQLDFRPPDRVPNSRITAVSAADSRNIWKAIHRSMYLRPELRVITNAGGGDIVSFMEWLGDFLQEHGSADMLTAAIRGSNLLASVDEMHLAGLDAKHKNVLSAQVEIGAATLATALCEGARIVVAGSYDSAAPFLATAVGSGMLEPEIGIRHVSIAAASRFEGVSVDIRADGVELDNSALLQLYRVRELNTIQHADVFCDCRNVVLQPAHANAVSIDSASGSPGDGTWKVRIVAAMGFQGLMLLEIDPKVADKVRDFCLANARSDVIVREYGATGANDSYQGVLKVEFRTDTEADCQSIVNALQLGLQREFGKKVTDLIHSVQQITKEVSTRISADRIPLSVDTRPAHERI